MEIPDHLLSRTINLGFNGALAAGVPWLQVPRAIAGDISSYSNLPEGIESELAAFRPFNRAALTSLASASLSVPFGRRLRRGSGPIDCPNGHAGMHPDERWFFINGIAADTRVASMNVQALSNLFERPFTLLYNATEGVLLDLFESAVGKGFDATTESAASNFKPLVDALADPGVDRVILISHSQGTIVAAVLLKALEELVAPSDGVRSGPGAQKESPERRVARQIAGTSDTEEQPKEAKRAASKAASQLTPLHISKLELYCFANCSTSMSPIATSGRGPSHVPWIESYGNEYDVVARLGVLAPPHGIGSARIEGDRYRRDGMWGHLLNVHYLAPMFRDINQQTPRAHALHPLGINLHRNPRLWEYYGGVRPAPYAP